MFKHAVFGLFVPCGILILSAQRKSRCAIQEWIVQGLSKELISYEGQTLDELRKDFEEGIVKRPTKPRHKETEAATDFRFSIFSYRKHLD